MKNVKLNLLWLPVCLLVGTSCQKESKLGVNPVLDVELGDGGSTCDLDPTQLFVSAGVLVFRTVEYYEAIVDAAVPTEDEPPEAGAPAPVERDGWEEQSIRAFIDASDHISYGSIHGVESEFDDPFIDAILNRDRAVQIGDWLIKLDLTRGKVFTIAAELPNAYQDLLGENSTTVRVFSMEEDVLAILRGESGTAQPGGGGVGGIDEDDLTFRAYLGGNVYAFRVEAKYHRYGIYFKIFARMSHRYRNAKLRMDLSVENTQAWARIRPGRKSKTIWTGAGFKNLVLSYDPSNGTTQKWVFYSGSRGLDGYHFFVKARVNRMLPSGIPIGRPQDSRIIGRSVNYKP